MSDTAPFAPVPEEKRRLVVIVKKFPRALHKTMSLIAWIMPFLLLGGGLYLFPVLQQPISWPWLAPAEVWGPLFLMLLILFGWLVFEMYYATHRDTSVRQLQADDAVSLIGAIIFSVVAGYYIAKLAMPWGFVLPWFGSMFDAFVSGFLAINNAAQKPFVSNKSSV